MNNNSRIKQKEKELTRAKQEIKQLKARDNLKYLWKVESKFAVREKKYKDTIILLVKNQKILENQIRKMASQGYLMTRAKKKVILKRGPMPTALKEKKKKKWGLFRRRK